MSLESKIIFRDEQQIRKIDSEIMQYLDSVSHDHVNGVVQGSYYHASIPDEPGLLFLNFDHRDQKNQFIHGVRLDVDNILRVLATGYCGLDCHNLWLKNVDERVRLKKKTVDNIYVPYMEKLFGEKIIRGRSYRRVRFP